MKKQLFILILILNTGILFAAGAGDSDLEKSLRESEEAEFQKAIQASEEEAQLQKILKESALSLVNPEDTDLEAALAESSAYAESAQASGKKVQAESKVSASDIEEHLEKLNQMIQNKKRTGKIDPSWVKIYGFAKDLIAGLPEDDQVKLLKKTGLEGRLKSLKSKLS